MFDQVIRKTQDRYRIKGKDVCNIAGISTQHWSQYRQGKVDITSQKLWAALVAMEEISPGAGRLFCSLLAEALSGNENAAFTVGEQLENLISCADRQEMALVLQAISRRWMEMSSDPTDKVGLSIVV